MAIVAGPGQGSDATQGAARVIGHRAPAVIEEPTEMTMLMSENARPQKSSPRVLIVDDDETFGRTAARLLSRAGLYAVFHRGPFGTVNAVRASGCDVLLLDINMPSLDGAALARMVTSTFGGRVRVVLCSNMASEHLARLAVRMGLQGGLSKEAFEDERLDVILAELRLRKPRSLPPPP